MSEIEDAINILYLAFSEEFYYVFDKDFEYGRKLFINFYKTNLHEKDLNKFLVARINNRIIATINFDDENPHLLKFLWFFLKMNLHFLRSHSKFGLRRAIHITLSLYWFFIEDFRQNSCYINMFGVHPEYQHCGIGTKMLQAIETISRKKHLRSLTLDVAHEDGLARHFYKKMGFKVKRSLHNSLFKYYNGIEAAYSMERIITYSK